MSFFENTTQVSEPEAASLPTEAPAPIEAPSEAETEAKLPTTSMPWWISEKFFWTEGGSGRMRLSPLPEFLRAVEEDAEKLVEYGAALLRPEGGSTEGGAVDALRKELSGVIQSLSALDEREVRAFTRFLVDRATRNAVYAATTQFEIDTWVAKSATRGQDASEHQNFGQKESRRDGFAVMAAAFAELVQELLPQEKLTTDVYAKVARQVIFQQANHNTRELLSPKDEQERGNQAVQAAVLASRPI